jgi:hypothetical protein
MRIFWNRVRVDDASGQSGRFRGRRDTTLRNVRILHLNTWGVQALEVQRSIRASEGTYLDESIPEDVESLARKLHDAWVESMQRSDYHLPCFCPYFGCGCSKCCPDLVDFEELPSEVREKRIADAMALALDLGIPVRE